MHGLLLQKVPPTTVAPTYKLTLPSEFVLTHMPDMMNGETFTMVSADGTTSFAVTIVPRCVDLPCLHLLLHRGAQACISMTVVSPYAGEIRTNLNTPCKLRLGSRYATLLCNQIMTLCANHLFLTSAEPLTAGRMPPLHHLFILQPSS